MTHRGPQKSCISTESPTLSAGESHSEGVVLDCPDGLLKETLVERNLTNRIRLSVPSQFMVNLKEQVSADKHKQSAKILEMKQLNYLFRSPELYSENILSYMLILEFWKQLYFTSVLFESKPRMFANKSSTTTR